MPAITLRFVTLDDEISKLIRFQAGVCMPFTPSHVECVSTDGKWWIGQHADGGMKERPAGYDSSHLIILPDGTPSQKFVVLSCTQAQENSFYDHVHSRLGAPYDWKSLISFADPAWNLHAFNHLICSAEMDSALRAAPAPYFAWPGVVPFHHISPRDLFLVLSTHVEIPHNGDLV